jgi:ferredoxin
MQHQRCSECLKGSKQQSGNAAASWLMVLCGLSFASGLLALIKCHAGQNFMVFLAMATLGGLIAAIPFRSFALFAEFTVLPIIQWICLKLGVVGAAVLYISLVAAVLASLAHKLSSRFWVVAAWLGTILWFCLAEESWVKMRAIDGVMIGSAFATLLLVSLPVFWSQRDRPKSIDVIFCSYTGNTSHFMEPLLNAVRDEDVKVVEQRFHYYRQFQPELTGDALIVAFPVIGWKPPWPMFNYLLLRLPWGKGKPAFVIHTSAGGPENAGVLTWLVLTLRGYHVLGRASAIYPISLPTARLGPARFCRWIDSLLLRSLTPAGQTQAGHDFARGRNAGIPFLFWPSPLFLAGILLDNKWVDIVYRNHVFRRRCNGCGLCVKYCPTGRLRIVNGYPKAGLTCALCFTCVNHCPRHAMQMWLLTEYGNPYPPKTSARLHAHR